MINLIYCRKCKKTYNDVVNEDGKCECGNRSYISGDNIILTDKGFTCSCDNPNLRNDSHLSMEDCHSTILICTNCNSKLGITTYKNEEGDF